jgi:uncharacterized protein (DUF1501 family)
MGPPRVPNLALSRRRPSVGFPAARTEGRGVAEPDGTVVIVKLQGGLDGLSVVIPYTDSAYAARRPTISVPRPGDRHGAIDLGRGLGLHPALAPLHESAGRAERFAVICGVGVPDHENGVRSHLPSREFLHRGGRGETESWIARLLRFEGMTEQAVWSFESGAQPMVEGVAASRPVVAIGASAPALSARDRAWSPERPGSGRPSASPHWADVEWMSSADRLARGYPEGRLGRSLAASADMIRADRGLRLVVVDHDGYDTHVDQGDGRTGLLTRKLSRLARAVAAFWTDIGERDSAGGPVTVIAITEFGRAIDENGSGGTEHGRGGVALAIGDEVVGGVHGDLPSLADDEVWPVSVDIRRVLADAVASHGFRPWRSATFPGLSLPNRSLGLLLSP